MYLYILNWFLKAKSLIRLFDLQALLRHIRFVLGRRFVIIYFEQSNTKMVILLHIARAI